MQQKHINLETTNGSKNIAYTEWGDSNNANLVFCVHGLSRNSRDFDYLAESLEKDYRVICIDIIGRGDSDWFDDNTLYAYPEYIALCLNFLNALDIKEVNWVGTSMGGLIGLFVASQPESPIKSLVLNDIGPFIPKQALQRIGQYIGKCPAFNHQTDAKNYLKDICSGFGPLTESQWQHLVVYGFKQNANGQFQFKYDPEIAAAFDGEIDDIDLFPVWQQLSLPRLVLRGEQSDILQKQTAIEMSDSPTCQLKEFADIGHAPMLMAREQIEVIYDFLAAQGQHRLNDKCL